MTAAELIMEIAYRSEERLALLGFFDKENTPEWARKQALREARGWAKDRWPKVYQEIKE